MIISDDAASVLSTPADVVLVGVYSDMERMFPMCKQCLEHRHNVISAGEHHSYPWRMTPALTTQLDEIAKANRVTISGIGNQDFFNVNLGSLMSGVFHRIERIAMRSLTDVNNFGPEVAEITHVDLTRAEFASQASNHGPSIYTTFWENLASDLELTVLDITQSD